MTSFQFRILLLVKAVFLCLAIAMISTPSAEARACGGKDQKACGVWKPGPQCNRGLTKYKGYCRAWGQRNQKPWPAKRIGFQCDKNLAPLGGKCVTCGKADGQPGCEVGRIPFGCGNGLENKNGICRACGGPGQKACQKSEFGYPCRGDRYAPDNRGICVSCGGLNQPACRAMKEGRQCAEWTTETNGYCKPCGDEGQQACKITDRGDTCKPGMKRKLNGTCVLSIEEATRRAAMAKFDEIGMDTINQVTSFAKDIDGNDDLKNSMQSDDGEVPSDVPDNQACAGDDHKTWSLGVSAGAQVIVGVDGEVGGAFRCAEHGEGKDMKWYSSGAVAVGPGVGVDGGVTVGMWMADFNQLRGKSHGYVFDLVDLAGGKLASEIKGVGVQPSIAIAFWFEKVDKNNNDVDEWLGKYQGFTISFGAGAGKGISSKYVSAKTSQFCDYDMGCALHEWREMNYDGRNAFVPGGTQIYVRSRDKEQIIVNITRNGVTRSDLVFERATTTDWRDYKHRNNDGDVVERICFRRGFTVLRYMNENRNCDRGIPLEVYYTDESEVIDVIGFWEFESDGETKINQFLTQTDMQVTMRRVGTTNIITYDKIGDNKYRHTSGSIMHFRSDDELVWTSADAKRTVIMTPRP
ncbi:MAG: hypothetical protein GYB42_07000 [Alphaproteobacteria bacterium]|nr:hypothetical protein [Alphaproteobacteria bacterium]